MGICHSAKTFRKVVIRERSMLRAFPCRISLSQKRQISSVHSIHRWKISKEEIPERFTNQLMVGNHRHNGKKQQAVRIFRQTLEIIHLLTGQNPLEVLFEAIVQSGAREDSTRIGSGGTVRRQAVDVSPLRRINQAIYLLCKGSREAAFRSF